MFLPVSADEMKKLNIEALDFVYVIGDAYVDHPSFGPAIISRVLEAEGYTVGIIPQPDWHSKESFTVLGKPRLGFLVSAGNIDSMVNRYTVGKKIRNTDFYSPGGMGGMRPDRATIVYTNKIREAYGRKMPIIIGGIEASLRRFAHYDYWQNKVRRNILTDSGADILIYGMGERQIVQLAEMLNMGVNISDVKNINGTAYLEGDRELIPEESVILPSYDEVSEDKYKYAVMTKQIYEEQDYVRGKTLVQLDRDKFLVQNPPAKPLDTAELDRVYSLPYENNYHPMYEKYGGVPAISEVKFSVQSSRGCFGSCSFCALALHQGRTVTARSHRSIIDEVKGFVSDKDFKGYVHDVGGPTANFRHPSCEKQLEAGVCKNKQCLFPAPCKNIDASHKDYLELLRKLKRIDGVKKVFIRSGIRYDYLLEENDDEFLTELIKDHISGQLRVAPEHISDNVLKYMGKPPATVYNRFLKKFNEINKKLKKNQYAVPYLMSSHPGSTLKDAIKLAEYLRDEHLNPLQVQDFYPTPGSLSTAMYYTGIDPRTMQKVYVPVSYEEKQMQRALLQYKDPKNRELVKKALKKAGREDLIGTGEKCLVRADNSQNGKNSKSGNTNKPNRNISKSKGEIKNGKNFKRKNGIAKSKGRAEKGDRGSWKKRY